MAAHDRAILRVYSVRVRRGETFILGMVNG
jgi:hypothetical protein